MEDLKDGLVLHRVWIGLDVFEADESGKNILSSKPLIEGSVFSLGGCLRGQAGVSSTIGFRKFLSIVLKQIKFIWFSISVICG